MYKKLIIVLMLMLCCFPVVMAETWANTLGGTAVSQQTGGAGGQSAPEHWLNFSSIQVLNIEYAESTVGLVNFDNLDTRVVSVDAGAPSGASTPFTGRYQTLTGVPVVTGVIGYQRVFNLAGTEIEGYQYIQFNNDWNLTSKTGTQLIVLDYDHSQVYNMSKLCGAGGLVGNGNMDFSSVDRPSDFVRGTTLRTISETVGATYTFTKPSGLGITGEINKTSGNSRAFVFEGSTETIISSEGSPGIAVLNINTAAQTLRPSILSPSGIWYNGSVLFTANITPTPTPAPTAPTGYTRTTIFATDGSTGGKIIGATLTVKDVENGSWTNSTSSMAGSIVDVITGHTLNIYGSYPGVYTSSQELGAVAGGNYYLPLMPPVPTPPGGTGGGYVNLFVNVFDASTNNAVQHASVTAKLPTGATTGENTGTSGTVLFLVPNNTVVILGASAAGYQSMSQSTTSGTGADKIVNLKLTRQTVTSTVTPVVTDPGTGAIITAVPTIDARTSNQKDTDMMNLLRDNGGTIVSLAIVAILFGLLKMIMKF